MTEEKDHFDYEALLARIIEQAARVLPYFDENSEERSYAATLFQELEHHIKEAQKPFPEPRLERYHMEKALGTLFSLEHCLRDSDAPTELEETFSREMQPIRNRYFGLMEQYPNLEDKLTWHEFQESKKEAVPEEWTERLLKKIQHQLDNPTVKRRH